jgi:DNA polymerase-1
VNFQNIPKGDKVIKRAFVPKQDALLFFDYKQLEYRLLAFYIAHTIGDEGMAEVFRRGDDLHEETAKAILGKSVITDDERDIGKTWNFLTIYGGGAGKAAANLGIPLKVAQAQQAQFFATWPSIKLLNNPPFRNGGFRQGEGPGAIQRRWDERGYLTTLFGRHLEPRNEKTGVLELHKALNYIIQGTGGDLARVAMVKIHAHLKAMKMQSHLVNYVHDEFAIDAVMDELPYLQEQLPILMDYAPVSELVPIEADMEWTTTNWAEKETYAGRLGDAGTAEAVNAEDERKPRPLDRNVRVRA